MKRLFLAIAVGVFALTVTGKTWAHDYQPRHSGSGSYTPAHWDYTPGHIDFSRRGVQYTPGHWDYTPAHRDYTPAHRNYPPGYGGNSGWSGYPYPGNSYPNSGGHPRHGHGR